MKQIMFWLPVYLLLLWAGYWKAGRLMLMGNDGAHAMGISVAIVFSVTAFVVVAIRKVA